MLAKIKSAGLSGMDGFIVTVEVDESDGLPKFVIVGNVSASVRESLDRCQVALRNAGINIPPKRLTINLAPADRRKDGTYFDLAIATGILKSIFLDNSFSLDDYGFVGELGLDGRIRHVNGILPIVTEMKNAGLKGAVVPKINAQEALVVSGMDILGVEDLTDLCNIISKRESFRDYPRETPMIQKSEESYSVDFSDIHGQSFSVRAALIAAAGGHNLLLSGVAGSGKTMIARRIPTILPRLTREENIEITKIYSIAGLLPEGSALMNQRPFRTPHHTITTPALVGGSSSSGIVPGEIALASKGVLFLDELPLFSKASIEALRQPLEEKKVVINRLNGSFLYPADCMLVAAMNPCPCGYYPDRNKCHCTESQIRHYQRGISKPILERIDLCVEVSPVSFSEVTSKTSSISSEELREMVQTARTLQAKRFAASGSLNVNADMSAKDIEQFCKLNDESRNFIGRIFELKSMSMRTYHKVLKVARTIADLEGAQDISISHLSEAVSYRGLEDHLYGATEEVFRSPDSNERIRGAFRLSNRRTKTIRKDSDKPEIAVSGKNRCSKSESTPEYPGISVSGNQKSNGRRCNK
ncbi:YifB family Mg chelatase-like AAA ATPase [Oribacterium sp. WCC10]|uniref:YifB family Mg chelatase-like AAA ATPase n=1 Tax=Oribacterium sp. WCC10 TaxID=1855343 RepID=UPI0008E2BCE5|nr:YifB family Mg chelatase-like AAA ATPase [Oribacterium sp. WCC10]SFG09837.1 magnesium chelatase family protein [Oribacterium sp. WCC10]